MLSSEALTAITGTVKNYGRNLDADVLELWMMDLEPHSNEQIIDACRRYRANRSNDRAPTIGQILALICHTDNDGRPTPDEAWGIVKPILGDEQLSAILTIDMAQPCGLAAGVWPDQIGARRTFIDAYTRAIEAARAAHEPVKWWLSQGYDKGHRADIAACGLADGRLSHEQVKFCLPAPITSTLQNVDLIRENIDRTDLGLTALPDIKTLSGRRTEAAKFFDAEIAKLKEKLTNTTRAEPYRGFRPIRNEDLNRFPQTIEEFKRQYRALQPKGTLSIGIDGAPQRWVKIEQELVA